MEPELKLCEAEKRVNLLFSFCFGQTAYFGRPQSSHIRCRQLGEPERSLLTTTPDADESKARMPARAGFFIIYPQNTSVLV